MNKISYVSLGCKVNLYESNAIINMFLDNGFELVDFNTKADVVIINTCTVTSHSDSKSRKMIRRASKISTDSIICVMGCFVQLNEEDSLLKNDVHIICGTSNRSKLYENIMYLLDLKKKNMKLPFINLIEKYENINTYEDISCLKFSDKTRGFLKIQDGCNNFCSYCAIPYARGKSRSRSSISIINEYLSLVNNNVKEIVLSGINTGSYSISGSEYNLTSLLLDLLKSAQNLSRIRISSIEVTEISEELIKILGENTRYICNHLHIPLQTGSNLVLSKMNRKYDTSYYLDKINYIRKVIPNVSITSDILVGFDYESDEEFNNTYEFIKKINFSEIHVFPYSQRKNTLAYKNSLNEKFIHRVSENVKAERVNKLLELNIVMAINYRNKFLNKTLEVLIEKIEDGICYGYSENYIQMTFKANQNIVNTIVCVKLIEVGYPFSKGEIENV